jgi:hypothetical protein
MARSTTLVFCKWLARYSSVGCSASLARYRLLGCFINVARCISMDC